jgi:hypothetical protein
VLDHFERLRTRVTRDVVRAGQDDEDLRVEVDHVGIHADQHLRRRLAADAPVHVRLSREVLRQAPPVGDRVAHEDHALRIGGLLLQLEVGRVIASELVPVLELVGQVLRGLREAAIRPRRAEFVDQLRVGAGSNRQCRGQHHPKSSHRSPPSVTDIISHRLSFR